MAVNALQACTMTEERGESQRSAARSSFSGTPSKTGWFSQPKRRKIEPASAEFKGWLMKQGHVNVEFKRRYFLVQVCPH